MKISTSLLLHVATLYAHYLSTHNLKKCPALRSGCEFVIVKIFNHFEEVFAHLRY